MTQATEKDIGKWCKFYTTINDKQYLVFIARLAIIKDTPYGKFIAEDSSDEYNYFRDCTPLTQEQIKVLGLEE